MPLPKGFKSAQLDNRDKGDVAIGADGFRLDSDGNVWTSAGDGLPWRP